MFMFTGLIVLIFTQSTYGCTVMSVIADCGVGYTCNFTPLPACVTGCCVAEAYTTEASYDSTYDEADHEEEPTAVEQVAQAAAPIAAVAAISPPPVNMFPPQGAPQPGSVSGGGGITPAVALAVPIVAADVALLTAGIAGAVVLSVYSSSLPQSGFLIPRTVDATAVTFTEPDIQVPRTSISRQDSYGQSHSDRSCPRPVIRLGSKINSITENINDKSIVKAFMKRFAKIQERFGRIKMRLVDKFGIGCLVPRLIHPFEPILSYVRCKLGLDEDEYMEAAPCNSMACEESIEEKEITHDRGPPPMTMMNLDVQTMSDCFGEMRPVMYGARVLAKIVNDQSCEDPNNQQACQEAMDQGRIVEEDQCTTPDCNGPADDPFRPCFACEGFTAKTVYGKYYNNYLETDITSRQTDESYQATRQSARVVCRRVNGIVDMAGCMLRVDRGVQLRSRSYSRAQTFIQSEQYLSQEDIDIIRYYFFK